MPPAGAPQRHPLAQIQHPGPSPAQQIPQGTFTATAYSPPFGPGSINGTGITKGGTDLRTGGPHYVIATGPGSGLKMGDHVMISPNPYGNDGIVFLVDDTGGAIFGKHIDIFVPSHDVALTWGRKSVKVSKTGNDVGKPSGSVQDQVKDAVNKLNPVGTFLGLLSVIFHRAFWLRALFVLGGLALIAFAAVQVGKQYVPDIPIPLPI